MAREALAAYEATLAKEPNRLNATLGAGAAAEKLGNSDKARQHYGAAVVLTDSAEQIRPQIAQARAFMACLPSPSPSPPTVAFAIARCLRPDACIRLQQWAYPPCLRAHAFRSRPASCHATAMRSCLRQRHAASVLAPPRSAARQPVALQHVPAVANLF